MAPIPCTAIRWLEWRFISEAAKANRYRLENGNAGSEPFVTEPMHADLEEIFDTGRLLVEAPGFPLFRPLAATGTTVAAANTEEFFVNGPSAQAVGVFTPDGFVVRKGSRCRIEVVTSAQSDSLTRSREKLMKDKILVKTGSQLVFKEDCLFNSPSGAAAVVLGRTANGWVEWKDASGHTLHTVKRDSAA